MADVRVGDVRRPPPERLGQGYWSYGLPPFTVVRKGNGGRWWVRYADEARERCLHRDNVPLCPL